jgi:hypothetical protein
MKTKTSTKKTVQKPAAKKATAKRAMVEPAKATAAKQAARTAPTEKTPGKGANSQAQEARAETTASQAVKSAAEPAASQAEKTSGKSAGSQPKGEAATPAAPAGAKALFRRGDLVAHGDGGTYRVTRPPYTLRSVITVDAVEVRDGADRGQPRAIPVEKFAGPAGAAAEKKDVKTEGSAGTAAERKAGKTETPASKGAAKGEKTAKPSVAAAMRRLFAERGLEATYAQAEAAARAAKPDTRFSRAHFAWYRAQHKKSVAPGQRKAQA